MIQSGLTDSYRLQLLNGLHERDHEYVLALYGPDAELGPTTSRYAAAGEVEGDGYPAGGVPLTNRVTRLEADGTVVMEWKDVTIEPVSIDVCVGALVYNRSLQGRPSVAVIQFAKPVSATNGRLLIPMTGACQWPRGTAV